MKFFTFYLILPIISFSQTEQTIDLIYSNLMPIDEIKSLDVQNIKSSMEYNSKKHFMIDKCYKSGNFYVSSRDKNSILTSNIKTPQLIDSILPAKYPYGGSIGIISNEGTLINPRFDSVSFYSQNGWAYYGYYSNTNDLIHCGGGNKSVFYMGGNLWHLNGADQPQLIYKNIHYSCADLVVDSLERAWVLTGTRWSISDTLRVIDSTGYQVCKFPLQEPFDTYNAYGMIMYQNKIWLGIGKQNKLYPNKLLPLEIIDNRVVTGIPIDFADMFNLDLESCEVGLPEFNCTTNSTVEPINKSNLINVFPAPSSNFINLSSNVKINNIEVINLSGNILIKLAPDKEEININIEELLSGIYFIRIHTNNNILIIKQIKR